MADPRTIARSHVPDWTTAKWIRWRWLWWWPTLPELREARLDVAAWVNGWCNDCPYDPAVERGGYRFWRCERPGWHPGRHRFNNYTWSEAGTVRYAPLPDGADPGPRSPYTRRHPGGGTWWQRFQTMRRNRPTAPRHRQRRSRA